MSFIFASILCLLLWRVRRKQNKQIKKRSVLLTTHVYFMALCDLLISIWAILTYTPNIFDTSFVIFNDNINDVTDFLLAILEQFAVIGSASWYIMISYCLWRILFGHNPLSLSMKKNNKSVKSPNANLKKANNNNNNNNNTRNLKFRQRTDSYNNKHKISPVKEDESMQFVNRDNKSDHVSPNKYLNLPRTASYNNDPLIGGSGHIYTNSNSSLWSSFSSFSVDERRKAKDTLTNDALAFTKQNQIRERHELKKVLKRHHCFVWISTILLTTIPFIIEYLVFDSTIDEIEWVPSFYVAITIGVSSAICMLVYISMKIMKKKCKKRYREYKQKQKQNQKREGQWIGVYDGKESDVSAWGHNERGSSGASIRFSTFSDMRSPSGKYYKKETMIMKRFGVFVGCYLLCWTTPIIRRCYIIVIQDEDNVPDWLVLASQISIAIFPMANAIVWYSNPSFRKLISKNLNITIKFDDINFCSFTKQRYSFSSNKSPIDDHNYDKTQLTENSNHYHQPLRSKPKGIGNNSNKSNKSNKSMSGASNGHTPTTYGSFCDMVDYAAYSHFSYPNTGKNAKDSGLLEQPASFPRFKGTLHSTSDSSGSNNFDEYRNNKDSDDQDEDKSCSNESGGTISSMNDLRRIAEFEKAKTSRKHRTGNESAFSSMTMPSPFSGPIGYSSSLSDEMRQEHERYSSDFTDIAGVRSKRNSSNINIEFKLNDNDENNYGDLPILHQHLNTDTLNSEQIKELAKHCYYGSNGSMDFLNNSPSDHGNDDDNDNYNSEPMPIAMTKTSYHRANTSSNSFVNGLFSDDDEMNKFKNSINEYEDYGLLEEEEESDDNDELTNDALNVKENHFVIAIPNENND